MRFLEFFTANISNSGTRAAYAHTVKRFCEWCESQGIHLQQVSTLVMASYIELLKTQVSTPTVKLHLAVIRMLFDYLVTGHVLQINPATSVRVPKHVVKKGKTPVLSGPEARQLLDSIDVSKIIGLRDRRLSACWSQFRMCVGGRGRGH
jgi:site-specific recombinase XerD